MTVSHTFNTSLFPLEIAFMFNCTTDFSAKEIYLFPLSLPPFFLSSFLPGHN